MSDLRSVVGRLDRLEEQGTEWAARHGIVLLRVSLGIVFVWFGALKFFPGLSPAEDLAARTIEVLTLGRMKPAVSLPVLATWLVSAGLVVAATVRGGALVARPPVAPSPAPDARSAPSPLPALASRRVRGRASPLDG